MDRFPLVHPQLWGPGQQPSSVTWLGIKPVISLFTGQHRVHWATSAKAQLTFKCNIFTLVTWPMKFLKSLLCVTIRLDYVVCVCVCLSICPIVMLLKFSGFNTFYIMLFWLSHLIVSKFLSGVEAFYCPPWEVPNDIAFSVFVLWFYCMIQMVLLGMCLFLRVQWNL